ncbi:TPA: hypothetical protein RQK52_002392 [Vibrio vulnificus]|nr:hypothetical protein [Vibrio vulnificus]
MFKLVLSTGTITIISRLAFQIAQILSLPFLVDMYGKELFGELATVISLNIGITLFGLGLSKTMQNVLSKMIGKGNLEQISIQVTKYANATLFSLIFVLTSYISAVWIADSQELEFSISTSLLTLFGISAFFQVINEFMYDVLRGIQNVKLVAKVLATTSFNGVVMLFLSISLKLDLPEMFFLSYVLPHFITTVILISSDNLKKYLDFKAFFIGLKNFNIDFTVYKNKVVWSFFFLTLVQFMMYGADTLIIATNLSLIEAGEYNIISRFYTVSIFVFSAFTSVLWPLIRAKSYKGEKVDFFRLELITFFVSAISFICINLFAESIVYTIFDGVYNNIKMLVFLISIQTSIGIVTSYVIPVLNAYERIVPQIYSALTMLVTKFFLITLWGEQLKVEHVVISTIVPQVVFCLIPLYLVYRNDKHRNNKLQ